MKYPARLARSLKPALARSGAGTAPARDSIITSPWGPVRIDAQQAGAEPRLGAEGARKPN